jgi:hypothetical protein
MAESNRLTRELESRESAARPKKMWTPPQLLPEPDPEPGYTFRWIRLSTLNNPDAINISSKLREGWEPVKATSQPRLFSVSDPKSRFPDGIEVGGLLLCKIPSEFMEQREAYYQQQADAQINSVDNNFMRENDPRMPLFANKQSKVTFGRGTT